MGSERYTRSVKKCISIQILYFLESKGMLYPALLHLKSPFDAKNLRIQGNFIIKIYTFNNIMIGFFYWKQYHVISITDFN